MSVSNTKPFADTFSTYLSRPGEIEPHLEKVLRHTLENPGSLVRPRIVFEMSIAYDLSESHAKELAIALEYFHTASLVFDDLPCMDNAVHRRGATCAHLLFSEADAILAALALINRAYALCWRAVAGSLQAQQSRALAYIEHRLGIEGILNGQSLDLHYSHLPHNLKTTERIAHGKTVSLIRLTLVLPAILGGASDGELLRLERIAKYWGLAYQIVDDLKDVLQGTAETGKTVAQDISLDRPNIALAIGIPGAIERLNRLIHLGDKVLHRLVIARPSLSFLGRLRSDLQEEAIRIAQNACELTMRGTS